MARPSGLLQWHQTVSTYLPHLSQPQLTVLVLWSFGIVLAHACGLTTVAVPLAYGLGCPAMTLRAQLRAWYRDAKDKSGAKRGRKRRSLEVTLCFAPLLCWGVAWTDPPLPSTRPRHGRLDAGATLHPSLEQCGRPRLCYPRGLARRRGHACRRLAPPWGSPLWRLTGPCARRLDRDGAGRAGLVRPLALYDDASPGLASLLAHQSPRSLSSAHLRYLSSADAGGQPCRAAVGWPGHWLCYPSAATPVHPPGALGCGVSRPLAGPHRPAADRRRCRVVGVARLDRVRVQRQPTRRLALGTDQDAGARPGGAALARLGGGDLMDRQCGLPGRSRAPQAPVDPTPRAA